MGLEEREISFPCRELKHYVADIFRVVVTVPDVLFVCEKLRRCQKVNYEIIQLEIPAYSRSCQKCGLLCNYDLLFVLQRAVFLIYLFLYMFIYVSEAF